MNKANWRKLYSVISVIILIGTFCLAVAAVVWLVLAIPENADAADKLAVGIAAGMLGFSWLAATAVEFCIYFALKYFLFETKKTKGRSTGYSILLGGVLAVLTGIGWFLGSFFGIW